jgi:chitodextrinase
LVASTLVLSLVFIGAASAWKKPPSDKTPPTAPTNLRITASGPTSALAWNASTDNSSNRWYCVQRDGLGCFRVNPPQTTFTNTRLWPNTTFNYSVIAIDAAGNRSAPSNTVSYTTPPDTTPPAPPPALTVGTVYPTRISVSWTASTDNVSQVWYTLLVNGSPYGSDLIEYRAATVLDRSPATTYTFQVTARDHVGNTAASEVISVTTPPVTDTVPPTAPTNLRLSSETVAPEIWLDWDQSTDDTDPQSQIMYDVYVNGVPEHAAIGYGEALVYCPAEGPTSIVIRAVDTSGNESAPSNEIVFNC